MTLQTMQPEKMNQKHTQKRLHVFPSIHTLIHSEAYGTIPGDSCKLEFLQNDKTTCLLSL